jgi:hypothetical protein
VKNKHIITFSCIVLFCGAAHGQLTGNGPSLSHGGGSMQGPPVTPRDISAFQNIVNINGQDGFYLKKDLYLTQSYTIINGEQILGIPYLFIDWTGGTLTTPDNRVYADYKLKYNVQNQTLNFLNGTDSLEVNEPVKEFMLNIPVGDSVIHSRFVHSSLYQRGNSSFYYEVVLDSDKGQLVKTNKKVVASVSDGVLTSTLTKKYFKLESEYFYYDKQTHKINKIKPSSNMRSLLHLTEEDAKRLAVDSFDLSGEQDIIRLMKAYFDNKKAF